MPNAIRVLLVEDDEEDYLITRKMLKEEPGSEFELLWAKSFREGLELVRDKRPDAVLLDLSLPDSEGWETFSQMQAAAEHVPIILMTGLVDESLGLKALQEGAQDYLVKGRFDGYSLGRAVRYAIERERMQEALVRFAEELQQKNIQLEEDLDMAREVQRAMLPVGYPTVPAGVRVEQSRIRFCHDYRPSRMVGGDFFTLLRISDASIGVFVCDVMGHGLRSALVMAVLRGMLEELAPVAHAPDRLLTELNNDLTAVLRRPGQLVFASAFYTVIDVADKRMAWANAGHPVPMLVHADDGDVVSIEHGETKAPPLGVAAGTSYSARGMALRPGDKILIMTDGVLEAENEENLQYGRDRFRVEIAQRAAQHIEEVVPSLMSRIEAFSNGRDFKDDVLLLGVEIASND